MVSVVNDFFAALDSDPALLEAARARLLTREILELPQTMARLAESHARLAESQSLALAELAEAGNRSAGAGTLEIAFAAFRAEVISRFVEVDSRFAEVDSRFDAVDSRIDAANAENAKLRGEFEAFRAEVREKFAAVNARIDATNVRIDETNAELAKLRAEFEAFRDEANARFDRIEARLDELTRDVKTLKEDMGLLKGWGMGLEFERRIEGYIGLRTGFEFVEIVPTRERLAMMRKHGDMLGATEGERESFVMADALARVVDREGRDAFLAVEVSFTIHWQDTSRAIRNAGFLTKITGIPAHAAVAGARVNARLQGTVDSGEVLFMEVAGRVFREGQE